MRIIPIVFVAITLPIQAYAVDFTDYDAVCQQTAQATSPDDPAAFHTICTCAYGVITDGMGAELATIYARFELGDGTLEEMLPPNLSTDDFFAQLSALGPQIDETCTP